MIDLLSFVVRSGCLTEEPEPTLDMISLSLSVKGLVDKAASWAFFILDAETISIALVICAMFLADLIRRLMPMRLPMITHFPPQKDGRMSFRLFVKQIVIF